MVMQLDREIAIRSEASAKRTQPLINANSKLHHRKESEADDATQLSGRLCHSFETHNKGAKSVQRYKMLVQVVLTFCRMSKNLKCAPLCLRQSFQNRFKRVWHFEMSSVCIENVMAPTDNGREGMDRVHAGWLNVWLCIRSTSQRFHLRCSCPWLEIFHAETKSG